MILSTLIIKCHNWRCLVPIKIVYFTYKLMIIPSQHETLFQQSSRLRATHDVQRVKKKAYWYVVRSSLKLSMSWTKKPMWLIIGLKHTHHSRIVRVLITIIFIRPFGLIKIYIMSHPLYHYHINMLYDL